MSNSQPISQKSRASNTDLVEMDDDGDEREFSRSIVFGFFEQAEQTFKDMDDAL